MKFAKELEEDLVPEWRVKYLDYKQGKKKIKAVARALRNAQKSPRTPGRGQTTPKRTQTDDGTAQDTTSNSNGGLDQSKSNTDDGTQEGRGLLSFGALSKYSWKGPDSSSAIPVPRLAKQPHVSDYEDENTRVRQDGEQWTRYGSIVGTPPSPPPSRPATLNLPEPAMSDDGLLEDRPHSQGLSRRSTQASRPSMQSNRANSLSAFEVGKTRHPSLLRGGSHHSRNLSMPGNANQHSVRDRLRERPFLKRLFSPRPGATPKSLDIPMEERDREEIEARNTEFWNFLESELDKIEKFYKEREDDSTKRLESIKEQLHMMRDQRQEEIDEINRAKEERKLSKQKPREQQETNGKSNHPTMDLVYHPIKTAKKVTFHSTPKSNLLVTPPDRTNEQRRDYERRRPSHDVKYVDAKRKLKIALQEFYRGLELLKSYALLNRTGFRKINKKYDKTVQARPTMRFMNEKVDNAWFVKSTVLDGHITTVEDLYARYFENGSHKVAVGKLRQKTQKPGASAGSSFRNGLTLAAGAVFAVESLVYAGNNLFSSDPQLSEHTSYLLQLYGGYFTMLFLFLFFCIDCRLFTKSKVNYAFVFEFDTRHNLDWRQLSEIPCLFFLLQGFIMWLNFHQIGGEYVYIYYPVILLSISVIILFLPLPILYHRSRQWLLYSCWRLVCSFFYPVEFRDFFLGDMFCSETYAMGNIELFFCLYANDWIGPSQCNSSNSRLMGFLQTLPGIWRALQCLRRYKDTRNYFPHLVNCGKYTFTILYYMTLSLYRIDRASEMKALFIVFAACNAIYCSIWDLVMDWSLMDPYAKHPFLRNELAYKRPWMYYCAMVIDPILRFNWVLYAAIPPENQNSSLVSFFVSFSEVCRRGVWTVFRVENEHCTNVRRYRASRDVPLPYDLADDNADYQRTDGGESSSTRTSPETEAQTPGAPSTRSQATGTDLERATSRETAISSLRRRQTGPARPSPSIRTRVGEMLHTAHAQDFERKKKGLEYEAASDDDDDEDDEEEHDYPRKASNGNGTDDDDDEDDNGNGEIAREEARRDRAEIRDAQELIRNARSRNL